MATKIINITGFTNGKPIMTSNGDITCGAGDTIKWICPNAIGNVYSVSKTGGTQVFNEAPGSAPGPIVPGPKNENGWSGKIKDAKDLPKKVNTEKYHICAAPKGKAPSLFDPQITVNR